MILTAYPIIHSLDTSMLSSAFCFYAVWIPSYYYIKKRTNTESAYQPAAGNNEPQSIFELVSSKLNGVSNQQTRDHIISELLCGNKNPYTDEQITCEADWKKYVSTYNQDKTAHMVKKKTVSEQSKPNFSSNDIQKGTPTFCRNCGKPLRNDSEFCEYCGKSVK